jgi:protoporphyrinogen oxidase
MRVVKITEHGIMTEDGQQLQAERIVLATEAHEVQRLLGENRLIPYFAEYCFYFDAPTPPIERNMLVLNGTREGPITNLAIPSQASSRYAPHGRSLVAAVVIGEKPDDDEELFARVQSQLGEWFGSAVDEWRHLRTYHIPRALPDQEPPQPDPLRTDPCVRKTIYVCGEYGSVPSIQWALYSGRKAAEAILADVDRQRV